MRKYIFDAHGGDLLDTVEATPVCGEDFCDACGDCLHCYWESPCMGNDAEWDSDHFWVEYQEIDLTSSGESARI